MFNTMFDRGSLPAMEYWMHFTVARHEAIANNIANVETPFYKAVDLPEKNFKDLLFRAWDEQKRSLVGNFTLGRRDGILPQPGHRLSVDRIERSVADGGILRHQENNVDIDIEFAQMVKNRGTHNMLANLIGHQFSMIREAISERIG